MKTNIKHLPFATPVLFATVIILSSFAPAKTNSQANGGGTADGIQFSFNVLEQKGITSGFIHYGDDSYTVSRARWFGKSVILYTTDEHAFYICDNGKSSSWISDPILAQWEWLSAADFFGMHCINSGNIQVKE
jgi:hypothetical protein